MRYSYINDTFIFLYLYIIPGMLSSLLSCVVDSFDVSLAISQSYAYNNAHLRHKFAVNRTLSVQFSR